MSLRVRLVLCLVCVLALTTGLGCVLAGWHAAASVRTEMGAALAVGRQAVANGIEEIGAAGQAAGELRHLVATFDGNRHVRAALTDTRGVTLAESRLAVPPRPVPAWFLRAIGPNLPAVVLPVAGGGSMRVIADATNEVGEVWDQAWDGLRVLAAFCGLAALLTYWTVGHALRPLSRLSVAFELVGAGDYAARIEGAGPPELARLAVGFNRMAEQLGAVEARNRCLQEQLLTLQEEERAELARDLHDEIGPFLFAAGVDAASIPALVAAGRAGEAGERADAVRDSVVHMKRHIRSILGRLRPLSFGAVGLEDAIGNLVSFWRARHPDIVFALDVADADETLDEAVRATVCRVVQESLCNAVRHGRPGRIEIGVARSGGELVVRVTDDGIGPQGGGIAPGFGLLGMRERVQAQCGSLVVGGRANGRGLAVTARLPCGAAA